MIFTMGRTGRGVRHAYALMARRQRSPQRSICFYCLFPDAEPNTHFYTANLADKTALQATNPTNETGWVPLLRRRCSSTPSHSSFTAYTGSPRPAGLVGQSCLSGYQPVYRAYNNRGNLNDGNHQHEHQLG